VKALRGTAIVLALLVVAGCGSDGTKARREAVNSYFGKVAAAQVALLSRQGQINATLQGFSLTHTTPAELAKLRKASRDIADAERQVKALAPPKDARKLHALIVERLGLQRAVVDELIATALYVPKLAATAPVLQAAVAGLRRNLNAITSAPTTTQVKATGGAATLDRYAAAFGGYGDALAPVSAQLDSLRAPPILHAALVAERGAVARSIVLCNAIRSALQHRQIAAANKAIHSLFTVSATINGAQTQVQQAAAARAYNARLRHIDAVAKKVSLERDRLVRLIG
jgi:Cu/Ag efflux protein CusF